MHWLCMAFEDSLKIGNVWEIEVNSNAVKWKTELRDIDDTGKLFFKRLKL